MHCHESLKSFPIFKKITRIITIYNKAHASLSSERVPIKKPWVTILWKEFTFQVQNVPFCERYRLAMYTLSFPSCWISLRLPKKTRLTNGLGRYAHAKTKTITIVAWRRRGLRFRIVLRPGLGHFLRSVWRDWAGRAFRCGFRRGRLVNFHIVETAKVGKFLYTVGGFTRLK